MTKLNGMTILITRPEGQSASLIERLQKQGATPISFPTMTIETVPTEPTHYQQQPYDWIVFTSANAVRQCFSQLTDYAAFLSEASLVAVGPATANALRDYTSAPVIIPEVEYSSAGLLALPEFADLTGQQCLVVTGVGGKGLLAEVLPKRGASLTQLICYRRLCPTVAPTALLEYWQQHGIDVIVTTSSEGLANLYTILGDTGKELLENTSLLVISKAMVAKAKQLGYKRCPIVAKNASDDCVIDTLCKEFHP
tara:strand:+ start:21433 stop:22191 length:759 start_codon:yes stop_codon:yes gene_type:complete